MNSQAAAGWVCDPPVHASVRSAVRLRSGPRVQPRELRVLHRTGRLPGVAGVPGRGARDGRGCPSDLVSAFCEK